MIFLGVGLIGGGRSSWRSHCCASRGGWMPLSLQPADDRLGGGLGVGVDVQVGGAQPLPQAARVGVDLHDLGVGDRDSRPRSCSGRARRRRRSPDRFRRNSSRARSLAKVPAMSSANGLPSNRPLPSSVVASSAPASFGQRFERLAAPDQDRAAAADHDRPLGLGDHRRRSRRPPPGRAARPGRAASGRSRAYSRADTERLPSAGRAARSSTTGLRSARAT